LEQNQAEVNKAKLKLGIVNEWNFLIMSKLKLKI
jgi:hypothetical protein